MPRAKKTTKAAEPKYTSRSHEYMNLIHEEYKGKDIPAEVFDQLLKMIQAETTAKSSMIEVERFLANERAKASK